MFGNGHIDDDHRQRNSSATRHKAEKVEGNRQTQRNSKIKILAFLRFLQPNTKKVRRQKECAAGNGFFVVDGGEEYFRKVSSAPAATAAY